MKIMAIGGIGGPIHVMPDVGLQPIAGPFPDGISARMWILEHVEQRLKPEQRQVWAKLMARIGSLTRDLGLELGLLSMVAHGRSYESIVKYIPANRVDRRALASGEAA